MLAARCLRIVTTLRGLIASCGLIWLVFGRIEILELLAVELRCGFEILKHILDLLALFELVLRGHEVLLGLGATH